MFLITPCPMRTITARTTVHFELYKKKKKNLQLYLRTLLIGFNYDILII